MTKSHNSLFLIFLSRFACLSRFTRYYDSIPFTKNLTLKLLFLHTRVTMLTYFTSELANWQPSSLLS